MSRIMKWNIEGLWKKTVSFCVFKLWKLQRKEWLRWLFSSKTPLQLFFSFSCSYKGIWVRISMELEHKLVLSKVGSLRCWHQQDWDKPWNDNWKQKMFAWDLDEGFHSCSNRESWDRSHSYIERFTIFWYFQKREFDTKIKTKDFLMESCSTTVKSLVETVMKRIKLPGTEKLDHDYRVGCKSKTPFWDLG